MKLSGLDLREYLRFVVAGAAAIGTYLLLFAAFRSGLAVPLWAATGAAYGLATCLNYWLNYHWSFASKEAHRSAFLKYGVIALTSVTLNSLTVPFLVRHGIEPSAAGFAFAITWPIFSFFAQKYWAFKDPA
ncbi:MAG: GtrA family protein [Pseudomonadota bacterium]